MTVKHLVFYFQAEDGIRDLIVTGVQTCALPIYADIMFLSHSVTPIIDSVSVLKDYAIKKGVIDGKWNITTGPKTHIYDLARKNYFAVLDEGNGDENDFIHTEQFVLIDKERRIRGFYDGTEKEDMKKIKKDLIILKREYD